MHTRVLSLAAAAAALLVGTAAHAASCAALTKVALPGTAATITKAADVPAGPIPQAPGGPPLSGQLPAHCRVDGVIGAHTGRDGKAYGIRFALAMPADWNGRLLYQGGGGLNGSVQAPVGAVASGDTPALARGFAVVSSDSGHEGAVFDSSFFADQQAALDFLNQSIGKVMNVARPLLRAHYGKGAAHSYFVGCSTGGREAMISAQRYPNEFDGIVAGAPAMRTSYSNLALGWVSAALNSVAPKDAQGHYLTAQALSDADRQLVVSALLKRCDALDGVADGLIFNSRGCDFDPQTLQCPAEKTASCLSAGQVQAIKKAFAGPRTESGRQVYPGYAYDTGIGYRGPAGIPGLLSGGTIPVPAPAAGASFDVEAQAAAAHNAIEMAGDTNAWTNLSTFSAHGGKLIFFHGLSDPWFSALDTVDYYQRLQADNGPGPVNTWSRLFLVPGMSHCGGGAALDRFDMLTAIVAWAEQGRAPDSVNATGRAFPNRSRPLCPYPQHAQYNGSGDSEQAANFSCKE